MTAKSLFITLLYSGMNPLDAYTACYRQQIFPAEELQELIRLINIEYRIPA